MRNEKKDCIFDNEGECLALKTNDCAHCKFYKNKADKIAVQKQNDYAERKKHQEKKETKKKC